MRWHDIDPLFASREAYEKFTERQNQYSVSKRDFSTYEGNCFLGIDAGSTTTKAALVGEDGSPACTLSTAATTEAP